MVTHRVTQGNLQVIDELAASIRAHIASGGSDGDRSKASSFELFGQVPSDIDRDAFV